MNKRKRNKQKAYILAVVMIFALMLAAAMTTTFAVVYRYNRQAQNKLDELQTEMQPESRLESHTEWNLD